MRARSILLGLIAVAGLPACGHAGAAAAPTQAPVVDTPGALAAVLAAANATTRTSADVAISIPSVLAGTGTSGTVDASGSFDFASATGSIRLGSPPLPVRYLPQAAYLQPPLTAPWGETAKAPWVLVDLTGKDNAVATAKPMVTQLQNVDPLVGIDAIAWGASSAGSAGQDPGGVAATHYVVTVDLRTALGSPGAAQSPTISSALQAALTTAPSGTVTVDVWIDRSGHLLRTSVQAEAGESVTTTLSNLGVPVQVSAPPAAQTVDIATGSTETAHKDGDGS